MSDYERRILLTFDDGPNEFVTLRVLRLLQKYRIRAAFFLLGRSLISRRNCEIAKAISDDGHIVGNHSFSHRNLTKLRGDAVKHDILRAHDLIAQISSNCHYFRPPYGAINDNVHSCASECGYRSVLWNVDSCDWKARFEWIPYTMQQIHRKKDCVVLLHDIHRTTLQQLETFIVELQAVGSFDDGSLLDELDLPLGLSPKQVRAQ